LNVLIVFVIAFVSALGNRYATRDFGNIGRKTSCLQTSLQSGSATLERLGRLRVTGVQIVAQLGRVAFFAEVHYNDKH